MQLFYFNLSATLADCERLYRGKHQVIITDENGVRVSVPAKHLKQFLLPTGIRGRFKLVIDDQQKIVLFEQVL